jgi:AraC-like DNA-binding protein
VTQEARTTPDVPAAAVSVEQFAFSSRDMAPEAAFERYREIYARGSDVTRTEGPFHAEIRAWRLDRLILFDRRVAGVAHSREERAATDGFDHFFLSFVVSGEVRVVKPRPLTLGPGDMIVFDTRGVQRTETPHAHVITVSIARDLAEAAFGGPAWLHGRVLQAPDNLLLADFLSSLVGRLPDLPPEALPSVSRAFLDIFSIAASNGTRPGGEARRLEFVRREAVDRYIAAHLADRDLSAEAICAATGLSRSSLYRLLDKHGGVARHIQRMRLDALREALDRGAAVSLAQLSRAFGFANESHMNRLFAAAYGSPPGAYRTSIGANDPAVITRRWAGWLIELD